MKKMLKQFIADESGATAIEYGLIAAGLALAIVPALNGVGTALKGRAIAFSSEVDAGSRQENASRQKSGARF